MDEWETKIEKLAQSTINENVTSMAGVPTWLIVLLKRILEITGKKHIKEVWPSLELYMHGGVSFVPYKRQFEELIGEPINYLESIMRPKVFLPGRMISIKKACCLCVSMGFFMSLCL
jgi:hypothetical protein